MYLKELEEIGFTPREIKVYLALLEIGESSVGDIIKKSGIPSSKIYETLDKLKLKGLASSVIKENKLFFQAALPSTILYHLDEQRDLIAQKVIPQLKVLKNKDKTKRESTIYEGKKGIKSIYELMLNVLKKEDFIYAMGVPLEGQKIMSTFIDNFDRRRFNQEIKLKVIFNKDAKIVKKKKKLAEFRYMEGEMVTPTWIDIFGEYVVFFDVSDIPHAFLIKDQNIANSFKNYFDIIWRQCKTSK